MRYLVDVVARRHVVGTASLLLLRVDPREHLLRCEAFVIEVQVLQDALHQRLLVGIIVDDELLPKPRALVIAAQEPDAHRVERPDPELPHEVRTQESLEALAHLAGGLVRERDREDREGRHAVLRHQVGDSVRDNPCLTAACACEDDERAVDVGDPCRLRIVHRGIESGGCVRRNHRRRRRVARLRHRAHRGRRRHE